MGTRATNVVNLWQGGPSTSTSGTFSNSNGSSISLARAIAAHLATLDSPRTRRTYGIAWGMLGRELGEDSPLGGLDDDAGAERFAGAFRTLWDTSAPATWNARLDAVGSAAGYWQEIGWLTTDPARLLRRRRRPRGRPKAIPRGNLERFLERRDLPLRERLLYRMAYESGARIAELLGLDVPDLDLRNRCAPVVRKGGAVDVIGWQTGTARLLPRYLRGRTTGPLFVTDRKARVPLSAADLTDDDRARLSYRRADELLTELTVDEPGGPWNLHWFRHSAGTHAAEDGASASVLMAFLGHRSIKSSIPYTRVSGEALLRWQRDRDPARR